MEQSCLRQSRVTFIHASTFAKRPRDVLSSKPKETLSNPIELMVCFDLLHNFIARIEIPRFMKDLSDNSRTGDGTKYSAHPTSILDPGCQIGSQTRIWHHSHIRNSAHIGSGCVIGKNVYIDVHVVIGNRCKVQNNVSVYNGVTIGDDVFVGPSATFTNDLVPRAFNSEWTVTPTTVSDGASIGANATIVCGIKLGEYCMVAAGATVTRDVSSHQLVAGTPARHHGWVCKCGTVVSRNQTPPPRLTCTNCER